MKSLKYYRKAAGMTQQQLGQKANVTNTYISNIEKGRHTPSILTAVRLADALGCTLDDLLAEPGGGVCKA